MGVTGLWTVVQPAARPIKIETLNKKRLAVDASIWIYQFLKAVRDKEGNALRNSHVVGFFRRICKLLFFGIKPVFVFDGGAPALKRQTISGRKARREGRREDAVRTAGKLLALQLQRHAEEEEDKRKTVRGAPAAPEEEELPENLVYVDELQMTQQERQQSRKFKKKDQYHLPELDTPLAELGQPNDPRVMSVEELEMYAKQFTSGEDINVYDFSKIDFDSQFFTSLPASDRYNILNAARLRSRLRMGMSKDQLDTMFPDRMEFSRFQINRVKERNELTQRLMSINNNDEPWSLDGGGRVAGEKGREYVLVKNDGVEGGWALGVISDHTEGERSKPIDVDDIDKRANEEEAADAGLDDEDDRFEDVPIEGLNRLPKLPAQTGASTSEQSTRAIFKKRTAQFKARRGPAAKPKAPAPRLVTEESDSLFISNDTANDRDDASKNIDSDEEELQKAIAMSLEPNTDDIPAITRLSSPEDDEFEEVFGQHENAGSKPVVQRQAVPFEDDSDEEQNNNIMNTLITRSLDVPKVGKVAVQSSPIAAAGLPNKPVAKSGFSGPLPFEQLDLGSSLLGKKKLAQRQEESAGGFERDLQKGGEKKKTEVILPPWFSEDIKKGIDEQKAVEDTDRRKAREEEELEKANYEFVHKPQRLRHQDTSEVIDVDELEEDSHEVIDIDGSDKEDEDKPADMLMADDMDVPVDDKIRMGDIADLVRVEPPRPVEGNPIQHREPSTEPLTAATLEAVLSKASPPPKKTTSPTAAPAATPAKRSNPFAEDDASEAPPESEDEALDWEESDHEEEAVKKAAEISKPAGGAMKAARSPSSSPEFEFENVDMSTEAPEITQSEAPATVAKSPSPLYLLGDDDDDLEIVPASGTAHNNTNPADDEEEGDRDYYSDLSDEELLDQLATEVEEHARFTTRLQKVATSITASTNRQSTTDFDRELKNLRSQQKKDRRDADEVTQQMITECQQLLSHFGLPYITAPMEAEAQCAELVRLRLVDGIVTDDSDIFLFGGTRVYKNMFNASKFVECYLASDLEREFDLTRNKMIAIAHLLGSDYTPGVPGVGPVTALEILSEFANGGLAAFSTWWARVQTGAEPSTRDAASTWRKKFRRTKAAKLFLPPAFPDTRVDEAYLKPEVDADPSAFVWGVPDLDSLRSFLMATIGWTQERTDEVLVPVIRDMNQREKEGTQSNITQFLGGSVGTGSRAVRRRAVDDDDPTSFAPRRKDAGKSRRMEAALERLAEVARERRRNGGRDDDEDDDVPVATNTTDADVDAADSAVNVVSMAATANAAASKDNGGKSGKQAKTAGKRASKTKSSKATGSKKRKAAIGSDDEDDGGGDGSGGSADGAHDSDTTPVPRATRKKRAPRAKKTRVLSEE